MNKHEHDESTDTTEDIGLSLILWNDEVNSFEHVIFTLMQVLGWEPIQCEQVATIAHNRGKCKLKSGSYAELEVLKYKLEDRNLTVELC